MDFLSLMDFSVYKHDLLRFNSNWSYLQEYIQSKSLDGIELLIAYDKVEIDFPTELIHTVHLPFWPTWLNVWKQASVAAKAYFPSVDPKNMLYYCGGNDKLEMASCMKNLIDNAANLSPKYAVVHAAHVELDHVFTRNYTYDSIDVLDAFASLLNDSAQQFVSGEPSCTLAIENLWWPGLDFTNPSLVDDFAGKLNFYKWNFLLDTGHLMNTNPYIRCEDEAIDYVLDKISRLSKDAQEKIKYCHLNKSISGEYQLKQIRRGKPYNWSSLSSTQKYNTAFDYVMKIDQHKAFSSNRINEILDLVKPEVLVHELFCENKDLHALAIEQQMALINN